ncbi:hypothetical protein K8R20_03310 [bacterium]|nr:hypothetical protein [bacterium]
MSVTSVKYIRNSKKGNSFVGVFRYVKTSGVKSIKEGELYALLEISSDQDFPAERVAHMAWDGVVEGYMYSSTKSVSESLKTAIVEFTRRLKELMRNSKSLEQSGIDISLVIIAPTKEGIYLANLGENEIFVYKGGKIVNIIDVLEKSKAQTAGFSVDEDDLVVVSTTSLLSENMHLLVGKSGREEILKGLSILGKTLLPDQGMLCLHTGESEKKKLEPVVEESVESAPPVIVPSVVKPKVKKLGLKKYVVDVLSWFKKVGGIVKNYFSKVKGYVGSKLGNKIWFKKYAAKLSEKRLGKARKLNVRIDGYRVKNEKVKRFKVVILATLAVVVLVGGYQYTRQQQELRDLHSLADEKFEEVESKLSSAKEKLSTDREGAEVLIFSANSLLAQVPDGIEQEYIDRLNALEEDVLEIEDSLYKRVVVLPESLVGFFEENSEVEDIKYLLDESGNEVLVVTDKGMSKVYRVSIFSKEKEQITDEDSLLKEPMFVDLGEDSSIFIYDSVSGVVKASKQDSGWGSFRKITGAGISNIKIDEVVEFGVYGDNLYYLDSVSGKISKSVNYGTGYSSSTVKSVEDSGLVGTTDFFADFSIYALASGNEGILRYTAGEPRPIELLGIEGELGNLCCGDTTVNQDFGLYVFDSTNRRVLRFEKPKDSYNDKLHPDQLVLLNQYVYRGPNEAMWSDVKDIVVDRSEEYMYILDDHTVWRMGL